MWWDWLYGSEPTVTVNQQSANYQYAYAGVYFNYELDVNNQASPVFAEVAVRTSTGANETRWMLHAKQAEAFVYDADGNLTQDSLWTYTWDGENRLVKWRIKRDNENLRDG